MNQRTQILSLIAVLLVTFAMVSITKNKKAKERIYSSTILGCNIPPEARCTGSANCRACKNCKYCKHCSRGGSCGVCTKRSRTKSYTKPKQTKQTIFDGRKTNSTLLKEEPYYLKTLLVNKNSLNLRSGPDTSYYVIQELDFGEKLTILATHAKWIKVKVIRTKVIGFVHANGVLLVE
ncbi:SH3 domain-containing protein [Tenacibaculum gallaicum]|uniref:SH3 domain-containing protein n=1 Tax=Tenacibaculum gallaicum TaxID=561505 RepID=A0A3E0HVG5_9FLAO|nr:SH3 domain-containing protein [Tenacibaculum gallaicum]REH50444.1 SH3 domain-containing protein [Tenacibaculum gallaicum]